MSRDESAANAEAVPADVSTTQVPINPVIRPWSDQEGVRAFVRERAPDRCVWYGHGKVALRDGLERLARQVDSEKTKVVLPAYVPSGLVEPIKEAGYTPAFHRVTRTVRPDLGDIERLLDDDTLALISINYFGFPQPDHDHLRELAAEHDIALVEDNAHAALSMTPDGTLLGTRGDLGFTSFRKTLPVPDGAALFVAGDGPFPRAGVRSRPTGHDAKYLLRRVTDAVPDIVGIEDHTRMPPADRAVSRDGADLFGRDPTAIYERSKGPMSRLTALVLDRIHPGAVVAAKRGAYRDHLRELSDLEAATPLYDSLPSRTCPQSVPVIVEEWEPIRDRFDAASGSFSTWPPLPAEVVATDRFRTSRYLAKHLVTLPV